MIFQATNLDIFRDMAASLAKKMSRNHFLLPYHRPRFVIFGMICYFCTAMNTMNLNSVEQYNELYGLPTPHPLVTVLRLQDAPAVFGHIRIDYGLYAVFIKHGQGCVLRYGRREYDYQEGSEVSIAPGQSVTVEGKTAKTHNIEALLFHPDLIYGTSLARKMRQYSFFNYSET